ncbi:MAG: leucine-rich repeat domain-containing protein [Treponema sp.]|nr:leucine-rich repeat domain-containing protein [Treponema sp.]
MAPVISAQPQGAVYGKDITPIPLSVDASTGDGGTLKYQWYQNTENVNTGGTSVGTNAADYTPPTDTEGTFYYYVLVTNTLGGSAASTPSETAEIVVNNLVNAQVPVITAHPQEAFYFKGTASAALTVTASASDGGTLSYQWYQNTENANTGGTPVGIAANYTPLTNTEGTWYYYVTVTNTITDNSDGGVKVQSLSSNPAEIAVGTSLPSLAAIEAYLAAVPGGGTPASAVTLPVGMALSAANWSGILSRINTAGKYVNLNLSACTKWTHSSGGGLYASGTFDPNNAVSTGKSRIVSLTLPNAATGIKAGAYYNATFKNFTVLVELNAAAVETVGDAAFFNCTALTTVTLPKAQTIGNGVFWTCTALTTITTPEAHTIGYQVFNGCTALTTVTLPAAQTIGNIAFYGCTSLETVTLPKAYTIDNGVFQNCTSLETITLPKAYTIGDNVFNGCTALTMVNFPAAHTINGGAFWNCTALTTVTLPEATTIGVLAFMNCTSLTTVTLPAAQAIGNSAFWNCTALTTATFPAATSIGEQVFLGCTSLTTITTPEVQTIGHNVFLGCTALTTVTLPEATTIGDNAFSGCTALATVNLPKTQTINYSAFSSTGSQALTVTLGPGAPTLGTTMFDFISVAKAVTVKVPSGATGYGSSPVNTADVVWGNGFRGGGWTGSAFVGGTINDDITLIIQYQ